MRWDPQAYLQFGEARARPFADLMQRVPAREPATVVDLGCGPGHLTRDLARRWPAAQVLGVDNSPEMVEQARRSGEKADQVRLRFVLDDVRTWTPPHPVDVLVSNATLQWVPGHLDLLPRLLSHLRGGGWLAVQVPANFAERTHTAIAEVRARPRWRDRLAGLEVEQPASEAPATYLHALAGKVAHLDVWETTYLQVLAGPDAVVRWMRGTGLRPVLGALDDGEVEEFVADYRALVAAAYPERSWGTLLPYQRIFIVAQKGF